MTDPHDVLIAPGAEVHPQSHIGAGSRLWQSCVIREDVSLGRSCIVGRGAYIDAGVTIGDYCKIQNLALVYGPARLADGVFIGPAAVLTNDVHPRAVNPDGSLKSAADWDAVGVDVGEGAAIGARSVVLAGVKIGAWALIGAGTVVIRDVPAHALVVGSPGRRVGWVGRDGTQLTNDGPGRWKGADGRRYQEEDGRLLEVSR